MSIHAIFPFVFVLGLLGPNRAQDDVATKPIAPIKGRLFLFGGGTLSTDMQRQFLRLAGDDHPKLAIVANKSDEVDVERWLPYCESVDVIRLTSKKVANAEESRLPLLGGNAIWFASDVTRICEGTAFQSAIEEMDGFVVMGGTGAGAEALSRYVLDQGQARLGLGLLPHTLVKTDYREDKDAKSIDRALKDHPGSMAWGIPKGAALIFHRGQRIAAIGSATITGLIPQQGDWPARIERLESPLPELPYTTDWLAWQRSAQARREPLFPPAKAPIPSVPKGTLLLIGGGGSTEDMWERFIQASGGVKAKFVCIPQSDESFSAKKLRECGCQDVTVLPWERHPSERDDYEESILAPLRQANGVFLGGGRTFKFMEAYRNTRAHELIAQVLERGGAIAGTSAGAQIQGDFLVRGDPRTNKTLWFQGNDRGFGLLRGVIIDAHFRQRDRDQTLPQLLIQHPQMLGIGVDEATALLIQGKTAEVLGRHQVTFYDAKQDPLALSAGQKYHLEKRQEMN